jgi:hypothetical protein
MIHKTLFSTIINDGHSFKYVMQMIKNESDEVTFIISKNKMSMSFINKGDYAVHDFILDTDELSSYNYNIMDYDEYPITVNSGELLTTTKGIGKKDGIKISWLQANDKIGIQIIKLGKNTPELYVDIIRKEYNQIMFNIEYTGNEPVIKMSCKEFSELCHQASVLKCSHMEFMGCSSYVTFKGILHNGTIGIASPRYLSNKIKDNEDKLIIEKISTSNNSELHIVKSEELMSIKVPINTIKTLSKLHNIAPSGALLKICIVQDKPIKLECKIGSYGIYKLYVK